MAAITQTQLDYVAEQRTKLYRPAKFRGLLPIDSSVPTWADRVEHSEISVSAEVPVPIPTSGPPDNLPRPTLSREAAYAKIMYFGYSYGYSDRDLERAARQKITLSASYAVANQRNVELFLDAIAAGDYLTTYGLPGLLNISGKSADTACVKAAAPASGTTWTYASWQEIVADVGYAVGQIESNTYENMTAALVIISPDRMRLLTQTLHPITNQSALQILRAMFPGVRFASWQKCATAGAGSIQRMVTMATGLDVARMIVPQELTDQRPLAIPLGWVVPQTFGTAGVLVETPDAIHYLDGI
jgi:hypothetical protein